MDSYERVHEYLSKLGMSTMESIIDSYLETSHDTGNGHSGSSSFRRAEA